MYFSKTDYLAIGLAIVLVVAFFALKGSSIFSGDLSARYSETPSVVVNLRSQNDVRETGTASFYDGKGRVKVILNLEDIPTDGAQPAYIKEGTCDHIGVNKYTLIFPKGGTSETILQVSIDDILNSLPLAVNVYKSIPELNVAAACGEITQ